MAPDDPANDARWKRHTTGVHPATAYRSPRAAAFIVTESVLCQEPMDSFISTKHYLWPSYLECEGFNTRIHRLHVFAISQAGQVVQSG